MGRLFSFPMMTLQSLSLCSLVFVLSFGFCSPVRGDTVELQNGSRIDGTIVKNDDQEVILKVCTYGTVRWKKSEVKKVEKNSRTGDRVFPKREKTKPILKPVPFPVSEKSVGGAQEKKKSFGNTEAFKEELLNPLSGKDLLDVESWIEDLQRQRVNYRTRAETHLIRKGESVIPYVLPVARSEFVRARICALRILNKFPRYESMEVALSGLTSKDLWVRKFSAQLAGNISGIPQSFPWSAEDQHEMRKRHHRVWSQWYQQQEKLRIEHEKNIEKLKKAGR